MVTRDQTKSTKRENEFSRFARDEDGSMILFSLFLLIMMIWAGGIAVDVMRAEYTRVTLQQTLDRAVLAAADLDQTQDAKGVVEDYFDKADLTQYLDADSIVVNTDKAGGQISYRRVTATADADVDTLFMKMLGFDTLAALGASTAEEGITDLEISLVVDVSGSMGWSSTTGNSKIYELREAAKDFAYYMQCNPNADRDSGTACSVEDGKVSISLIPYAEQVVAGEDLLDKLAVTSEHDSSHCLTFEDGDFLELPLTLAAELDNPLLDADELEALKYKRTGHFDAWSNYKSDDNNSEFASNSSRTCRTNDWREIRLFVEDHNELYGYLDSLSAGGNTSSDLGMKWGASLLDPAFQPVVADFISTAYGAGNKTINGHFAGRPYSYTQDYSMKVIVLMTDGVNTTQNLLRDDFRDGMSEIYRNTEDSDGYSIYKASTDQYYYVADETWNDVPFGDGSTTLTTSNTTCTKKKWYKGKTCTTTTSTSVVEHPGEAVQMSFPEVWEEFNTDWYESWSWLSDPDATNSGSTKDDLLDDICTTVKDEGVIIYAVGFEVTTDSATVMSNCASTPGHYFNANGANLAEVFGVIASSINQLRLTQ